MNNRPVSLIVGADSTIGSSLMQYLRKAGERVLGTTRRRNTVSKSIMYLDLAGEVDQWICPMPISVAYLCAGVTNLEACRNKPEESAFVNVHGIATLVEYLVNSGAFVVFLSTNQVFDGSAPHRLPDDPVSPVTEYGQQKAEAERRLSQLGEAVSIVRLTKIIESTIPLFSRWADSLKEEEVISPFTDMRMAPVPLNCVISILRLVADLRFPGILQVSGDEDISYAEAACIGARLLGFDVGLVKPITVLESGNYMGHVPANTTLNIDCLKRILGIVPPDVRWTIKEGFKNMNRLLSTLLSFLFFF